MMVWEYDPMENVAKRKTLSRVWMHFFISVILRGDKSTIFPFLELHPTNFLSLKFISVKNDK